jgi:hypothetical protein
MNGINFTWKKSLATRIMAIDFSRELVGDELLSGEPTVSELYTSALTISGEALTDVESIVAGRMVAKEKAVVFSVGGGSVGQEYLIRITVSTTEGQTLVRKTRLLVT